MALSDPKNTLAYHRARSLSVPQDLSGTPLPLAMSRLEAGKEKHIHGTHSPDICALRFYYLNHMVALVGQCHGPNEDLGKYLPLVERYYSSQTLAAARMAYYLMCITTREARHWKAHSAVKLAGEQCSISINFLASKGGKGESGFLQQLKNNAPSTLLGRYTKAVAAVFYDGSWGHNPSFGGPKWGNVTDTLVGYLHGDFSAETMMDTAFTLAHNGGPIFNKGMVYDHYTNEFLAILDRQAAGKIPGFLKGHGGKWLKQSQHLANDVALGFSLFPSAHAAEAGSPSKNVNLGGHSHNVEPMTNPGSHTHQQHHYQVDAFKSVVNMSEAKLVEGFGALMAGKPFTAQENFEALAKAGESVGETIESFGDMLKKLSMDGNDEVEDAMDDFIGANPPLVVVPPASKKPKGKKIKFNIKGKVT